MMGDMDRPNMRGKGLVYGVALFLFFIFSSIRMVPPATIGVVALFGK